ncbi:hypothetical protein [Amedibacillus sp. YH-ame10]
MNHNTNRFFLKLFTIFYLTEIERMSSQEISFIMDEDTSVITTYYHIGQIKALHIQKHWGGHQNDRIKAGNSKSPDGGR